MQKTDFFATSSEEHDDEVISDDPDELDMIMLHVARERARDELIPPPRARSRASYLGGSASRHVLALGTYTLNLDALAGELECERE